MTHVCSGDVTLEELAQALSLFGASETEVQNMLKVADQDGDGKVNWRHACIVCYLHAWSAVM